MGQGDKRLKVSRQALATAIAVCLTTMPKRIWRELEKYELLAKDKRHDPSKLPDARAAVAEHVANRFEQARWEITYAEPKPLGSPEPWNGPLPTDSDQGE